jgi:tetratricopeptide (TPR) repeat protein
VTQTYSLRDIRSMLGISKAVVSSLIASGFVSPSRGKRNQYEFTFQDVVLLRTAWGLQEAKIPARKILRSLRRLKATLPSELPLSGLRITAVGSEIAVKEGNAQWQVESGQLLMDFEVKPSDGTVRILSKPRETSSTAPGEWFHRGQLLEADDETQAEAAYRRAIELAPDYVDPYLNLGVMLCEASRCKEAALLYQEGLRRCPDESLLHFNLAIALEDLQQPDEALDCYEACIRLSPRFADAHYNAARLHEQLGHAAKAIRHYSEYRRLQR